MVDCPICAKPVKQTHINDHIDSGCETHLEGGSPDTPAHPPPVTPGTQKQPSHGFSSFFQKPSGSAVKSSELNPKQSTDGQPHFPATQPIPSRPTPAGPPTTPKANGLKRPRSSDGDVKKITSPTVASPPASKRSKPNDHAPLAERMRPRSLGDINGQPLLAPHGLLRIMIESNKVPSMVLWGGPGIGKTTIARLMASHSQSRFVELNATATSVVDLKKIFIEAANELTLTKRRTVVFCDEIHRFSKSQQDVFLRPVEDGTITLIGATTENPSFKVIHALLSRCRVFTLEPLKDEDITNILSRALRLESDRLELEEPPTLLDEQLLEYLSRISAGDTRTALNLLEITISLTTSNASTTLSDLQAHLKATISHDRAGDAHYTLISAFHKSVRGSSADGALYYLARMVEGGEDPLFIARRMVVIASEDVGLASETLLPLAIATYTACEKIGMPECRINLAHCATALALSKKSIRSYRGYKAAAAAVREEGGGAGGKAGAGRGTEIPWHLRNASTGLLKDMGAGKEYKYNPDYKDGEVVQDYLPEGLRGRRFLGDLDLGEKIDPDPSLGQAADVRDENESESQTPADYNAGKEKVAGLDLVASQASVPTQSVDTQTSRTDAGDAGNKEVTRRNEQSLESSTVGGSAQPTGIERIEEEPPIEIDEWEQ